MGVLDTAISVLEVKSGKSADVTRRTLTLGNADTVTGWYAKSFANSTIKMILQSKGASFNSGAMGFYARYPLTGFTSTEVVEGDEILVNSKYYSVKTVTPILINAVVDHYQVELEYRPFSEYPATSGTWHVDSESVKTDPRNRQKIVIDTYYTAGNVKLDDNATNATTATCFDGATYPITRVFTTKDVDVLGVISRGTSTTLYTDWFFGHKPYAFEEEVIVDIYAVNKTDVTATRILEAYEQEIRRIYTSYDAYTNVRDLNTITPEKIDLGYTYLYHTAVSIKYKRANDDYTPSLPSITWGPSTSATGTYVWPNVTQFAFRDPDTGDIRILPPGRVGEILQILGSEDFELIITSDMSVQPAAKTWKRPQASTPKTDDCPYEVFNEIKFTGKTDATKIYQTLNYGGGATVPVRVTEKTAQGETLTIHLKRYSSTDQSGGTYAAFYGNG